MAYGTVKWLDDKKGYGMIEHQNGDKIVIHRSEINSGSNKFIRKGARVAFDVISYEMMDTAVNLVAV